MRKSRFTEEQIIAVLKEHDVGARGARPVPQDRVDGEIQARLLAGSQFYDLHEIHSRNHVEDELIEQIDRKRAALARAVRAWDEDV